MEAVVVGDSTFDGPHIFSNAPRYEWRTEVHVVGQDEETRQRIAAPEELVHHFGYRTEVRELELHQRLD